MDIYIILCLNLLAICAVWWFSRKNSFGSKEQTEELKQKNDELSRQLNALLEQKISLQVQLSSREERLAAQNEQLEELKTNGEQQHRQILSLGESCAKYEATLQAKELKINELLSQIEELKGSEKKMEERLKTQFELISNKIIEESREKVNKFNAERMQDIMKPLEKDLKDFREQIDKVHTEQSKERIELETKIKHMVEISQGMSAEAKNLSQALRGNNKTAGNWGETILENILQNSGLTPGREGYELQGMLRDEEGKAYINDDGRKMIPDAIVHFPDNRNVIIDSKVSISAYTDYCNSENEEERKLHLKKHLASIKGHIDSLNIKSYERYVSGSLDFVMMFIPNDFAAMVALQEDLNLWQNAYNKKVLIISPTNLITSLKIVSDLWSREKQQQNVERILDRGRLLFEKCSNFLDSHKKIGDALAAASKVYFAASQQLGEESGIIRQAEMLIETGIKSKKILALRSEESRRKAEEKEEKNELLS